MVSEATERGNCMNPKRVSVLRDGEPGKGPVVYWMSRDQRVGDNWALIHAQEAALEQRLPLAVAFCLQPEYLGATLRQYGFMLKGLAEVEERLAGLGIPFFLLLGKPDDEIPRFVEDQGVSLLVTDFNPLRIKQGWDGAVAARLRIPSRVVDTHNIVPCRIASQKQEYGAHTLRPKLRRLLPEFLTDFPPVSRHPFRWSGEERRVDWASVTANLRVDRSVGEVQAAEPGERAGRRAMFDFLEHRLSAYGTERNDPARNGQSRLSPWLHFGQLSPQRVALEAGRFEENITSLESFLDELVVRRELSDNYCLFNPGYDSFSGFQAWARETLERHRSDRREYCYGHRQFEAAETHDRLWNAAQREMLLTGRMHGYLRMYWAKKILEWSESPEAALETAIALNDRYQLDGRDPNGYAGIAWSIGGVHDRPWPERVVYGKIRSMSYSGCARKFDVEAYVSMIDGIGRNEDPGSGACGPSLEGGA